METNDAIEALASLAQETRLAIFRRLVQAGPAGLPAGGIAEDLGVPNATLSFHLAHLTRAGMLLKRREGRSIVYSVHFDGLQELLTYLTEDCCQGRLEECCGAPGKACDHG